MLLAAGMGIKLLEVCLSIHKGCFMSDSFVMKLVLIKIVMKPAKSHYIPSAALILLV